MALDPQELAQALGQLVQQNPAVLKQMLAGAFEVQPEALDALFAAGRASGQARQLHEILARLDTVVMEVRQADEEDISGAQELYIMPLEDRLRRKYERNQAILAPIRSLQEQAASGQPVQIPDEAELTAQLEAEWEESPGG